MRLLYSELLKIRTAPRTTIGLTLGLLLLVGLGSAANASDAEPGHFGMETATWDVIRVVSLAPVFTLIFGILVVTWEYRHGTITQTYLAAPRREWVIGAKLGVSFAVGAILAAIAIVVALVVALFWTSVDLERGHWELVGRMLLGSALWGVLGTGLGALLQSQVGAIVTAFVWFLVAEPVLGLTLEQITDSSITDYLPGNVIDRLQNSEQEAGLINVAPEAYGLWTAALLAGAYAAVLAALGVASAVQRDVP